MIIDIKNKIENLKGKKIKVLVDLGRNKSEVYEGIVLNTYNKIWTLKTNVDIKSFGYTDVLIKSVIISPWLHGLFLYYYWFFYLFMVKLRYIS